MFIEFFRRNWPPLHSCCFLSLLWLHIAPSQLLVHHFIFGGPWWSSEMLWTAPPGWFSLSYLLDSSSCWSLPNRSPIIHDLLTYFVIPHINMLHPLVILTEINCTLTVAMNPNWIMYDTERLNQSSQPQNFLWFLMYSASVVERTTISCNSAFQLMTYSVTVNI